MMSVPNVLDKPKQKLEIPSPSRPSKTTGRRPMKSDNRLHCQVVSACVTKKRESYAKVCYGGRIFVNELGAYDETSVVTNLAIISSRDTELTDKLVFEMGM